MREDLELLGIEKETLPSLLNLLDQDHNAHVSINELLSLLDLVWHYNDKVYAVIMRIQQTMIAERLESRLKRLERRIADFARQAYV
mmetsp:Transcript_90967/g.160420  ORF Transcript_90967/g.160420 Transcript_90967/m.160420 type:complete len:86 (+) Transcript_90967:112-369(+)